MNVRGVIAVGAAALVLSVSACSAEPATGQSGEITPPAAAISTIDARRLSGMADHGEVVLVDVRTPEEFAQGHIAGAVNMPLQDFDPVAVPHEAGKQTVLYCRTGRRSEAAARQMVAAGKPAVHLGGGIAAWEDAGQPVTQGN